MLVKHGYFANNVILLVLLYWSMMQCRRLKSEHQSCWTSSSSTSRCSSRFLGISGQNDAMHAVTMPWRLELSRVSACEQGVVGKVCFTPLS